MRGHGPGWYAHMQSTYEREERQKKYDYPKETCPRCGGRLYVREGKYGEFLGCSNYPRCTYTKNI